MQRQSMSEDPKPEKKVFTFGEAAAALPEVRRLTGAARDRIEELRTQADAGGDAAAREAQARAVAEEWVRAMGERGIEAKGLFLIDFDNGSGYYCWQWPEASLEYYHSYEEGFRGRMRIH
jgi:hypothetical protein